MDMSGNVWEWCWDIYGIYPSGEQTNPHGATSGSDRVRRGGSWNFSASYCTVSYRYVHVATYTCDDVGFRVCRSIDNFVLVEGGTFNNGTSDVTVSSFYLDKFEMTQAGYQAVMGYDPASSPSSGDGDNFPVYNVNWYNAIEYCNRRSMQEGYTPCYSYSTFGTDPSNWPSGWNTANENHTSVSCNWTANGYRLPTEMEWMFAAKGGNQSLNYTYSGSNDINAVAWYNVNSSNTTHIVGTKDPNEIGLYDLSGNVIEWCWDIYGSYPTGNQTNPNGAMTGTDRVLRGGRWSSSAIGCTVSYRNPSHVTDSGNNLGFRVSRSAP